MPRRREVLTSSVVIDDGIHRSFDLAIDGKLRGCGLVRMKIGDVVSGGQNGDKGSLAFNQMYLVTLHPLPSLQPASQAHGRIHADYW